jgi:archaellum biogenesis ATPase FlaH
MKQELKSVKSFVTLGELLEKKKNMPQLKFLFSGVKEKSVGLIFGPSKSGKTIFCENLAMKMAIGADEYFDYKLDGIPKKVLFVGLEEFWENRIERNSTQINALTQVQKDLVKTNYLAQPFDFKSNINNDNDWQNLEKMILESQGKVVFIDSITRMNSGKLEDGSNAEKIMQKLRLISERTNVTIFCIHHTPKMGDRIISMDSIKGSSTFAQESDFAIAVTKAHTGKRYVKEIFFRYAAVNEEYVKEFLINPSVWLNYTGNISETGASVSQDRRVNNIPRTSMVEFLDSDTCQTYKTSELVNYFKSKLQIGERQVKTYLTELTHDKKIKSKKKGHYSSINCVEDEK